MNLHGIAGPMIAAVNPMIPVTIRISAGPSAPNASGKQTPTFETPGAFTAAIAGTVMTVSAVSAGYLRAGDTVAGSGVTVGTLILAQLTGTPGGVGTYTVSREQTVASVAMVSTLVMSGQIQSLSYRDLQMLDGINMGGERNKIYLYGQVEAVVRIKRKGGDLIDVPAGTVHVGTWLVNQVLEQYPDWVCAAITLQNGG